MNNTLTYLYHPVGRCYLLLFYRAVEKHRLRFLVLSQLTLHHTNYLICATNCPKGQDHAKIWRSFPYLQPIRVKITNGSRKDKVVISAVSGIQAKFHEGGGWRVEEGQGEGRGGKVKECFTEKAVFEPYGWKSNWPRTDGGRGQTSRRY